jgi:hypothetical protein
LDWAWSLAASTAVKAPAHNIIYISNESGK